MSSDKPLKLVYIAGYGRSGSTLLDIALGQQEMIFAAGEVTTIARHVWVNDEYCACGSNVPLCPFWGPVVKKWFGAEGDELLDDYRRSQEQIEPVFSLKAMLSPWRSKRMRASYLEHSQKLFQEISAGSGKQIIVDSSKLPGRASALAKLPGIELYIVHLVRDGRGVAWSMMKTYTRQVDKGLQKDLHPKPVVYTAVRWAFINLAVEMLRIKLGRGRSIRVRYEDFIADPADTLGRIVRLVGADSTRAPYQEGQALFPQHQVAGSRHRMLESITLRSDEGWKNEMPGFKQFIFTALCAPLMWRYGYPLKQKVASPPPPKKISNIGNVS
ncbi:MAG: sulfotransferase [Sphingorhabdus sp.]